MNRLLLFIVITLCIFTYLGLRLSPAFGGYAWAGAFVALGLLFAFPVVMRFKESDALPVHVLRWAIYFDMGFLSLVASLLIFRDILFLPFAWWKPEWMEPLFGVTSSSLILVVALVGLVIGSATAIAGPRVKRVEVPIENLAPALDGVLIAQISDLHAGPTIGLRYVEDVVRKTLELRANLIVLTGDIADGDITQYAAVLAPLKALTSAAPVYYVVGNHEYYWNGPRWISEFASMGMRTLLNTHDVLKLNGADLVVAGVLDPAVHMVDPTAKPDAAAALGAARGDFKLLLSHHPGIARAASPLGYDLQLSGHTHAGQFFPWTLVVPRVHEFSKGLKACGRMWVYVNPGTGSWGPPLRLGTTPEITLLRLVRKSP